MKPARLQTDATEFGGRSARKAFLLILVLLVVSMVTLAALAFSESMLLGFEESSITGRQLQARASAESGIDAARLFLALDSATQQESGGVWNNPAYFQAVNVAQSQLTEEMSHFSLMAPALDAEGRYSSIRYGLQNESARLNLNALLTIDQGLSLGDVASDALGASSEASGLIDASGLPPELLGGEAGGAIASGNVGRQLLLGLPGMTVDIADAILDWIDSDSETREFGAESDYYVQQSASYQPANAPLQSVEELLLVRGVTPELLFGQDQNRNGILEPAEAVAAQQISVLTGSAANALAAPPPPLGWAQYLTLYSSESNEDSLGAPRININQSSLSQLQGELAALQNETWSSFIIAYKLYSGGGQPTAPGPQARSHSLLNERALVQHSFDRMSIRRRSYRLLMQGTIGSGLFSNIFLLPQVQGSAARPQTGNTRPTQAGNTIGGNGVASGAGAGNTAGGTSAEGDVVPWTAEAAQSLQFDLSQSGVPIPSVLSLIDASFTVEQDGRQVTYASPFTSDPAAMSMYLPVLMDKLTTVSASTLPGRINVMEAPREVLAGIPNLTDEILNDIIQARQDGSNTENRAYETWLLVEGYLSLDQMRALAPLLTCGGDIYRTQSVGYFEEGSAFARIEAVIDSTSSSPRVLTYRRLDHLGRGYSVSDLGQRAVGIGL